MLRPRLRLTLGQTMVAVAMIAAIVAAMPPRLPVWCTAVLLGLLLATSISIYTSSPWIEVATWLSSFYPVLLLLSLYTTWLAAWYGLGHRPRLYVDDPKFISPLVSLPHRFSWLLLGWFFPALMISVVFWLISVSRPALYGRSWATGSIWSLVVPPLLWFSIFILFRWDPGLVFYWFMD